MSREALRTFARTIDETGVGYYPNSVFVHVDVRDRRAYWVDRSGPGERADYGRWPPPDREAREARERVMAIAFHALERLARPGTSDDEASRDPEPDAEANREGADEDADTTGGESGAPGGAGTSATVAAIDQ